MNDQTKSIVRHILTAVGFLLTVFGLTKVAPALDFLNTNLDAIWAAVTLLVGVITTLLGYFKDSDRHQARDKK